LLGEHSELGAKIGDALMKIKLKDKLPLNERVSPSHALEMFGAE